MCIYIYIYTHTYICTHYRYPGASATGRAWHSAAAWSASPRPRHACS